MAIVIPYGDAQAHGSIGGSITFRRSRGKVVLQKKPFGKQPNTPSQQTQKLKFQNAWKSYHQLNAWEINYLTEKASQLGTTPSNLYLSQYLKDEIPSTVPMNRIQEIIDASLQEPIATSLHGLSHKVISQIDSGPALTDYGEIFDNENLWTNLNIAPVHDRSYILVTRIDPSVILIPSDYPLIITWKDYSDVERVDLIRYPEITLFPGGPPSTTPMTDIKEIMTLQLMTPIGLEDFEFGMIFGTLDTVTGIETVLTIIDDNSDTPVNLETVGSYNNFFIEFQGNNSPRTIIPDNYIIRMEWKDFSDIIHEDYIKFPNFTFPDGGAYSTTDNTELKRVDNMIIPFLELQATIGMYIELNADEIVPVGSNQYGWIQDPANVYTFTTEMTPINAVANNLTYDPAPAHNFKRNYRIFLRYKDFSDVSKWTFLNYTDLSFTGHGSEQYKVKDDYSIYLFDPPFTLIGKPRKNKQRFWLADDISTYYDMAMTNLAKPGREDSIALYIANDFSLYYDEAMTQLASTPYF